MRVVDRNAHSWPTIEGQGFGKKRRRRGKILKYTYDMRFITKIPILFTFVITFR